MENCVKTKLGDILSDKQILHILNQTAKYPCQLIGYDLKPATEGLSGFLGDHFKIILHVYGKTPQKIHLFVKTMPLANKPKADFIDKNHFFRREALMYLLFQEDNAAEGSNPWCAKAYIYNDERIVLCNLCEEGYTVRPVSEYLDLDHILVTIKTIAQFHASMANLLMKRNFDTRKLSESLSGFKYYLEEPTFRDSAWLRAGGKLVANFLKEFSNKYKDHINLEENIIKLFIQACDILNKKRNTLNVVIHRDLWVNNILFKYENNTPTNAVIVDFQCSLYAPPALDIIIFLYLNTSKTFRKSHENKMLDIYYTIFSQNINHCTKQHLIEMGYNQNSLQQLYEEFREFSLIMTMTIYPYILMDSYSAKETFDNPETFDMYQFEDRSEPVLIYASKCPYYRDKILEVCEEFYERYHLCLH